MARIPGLLPLSGLTPVRLARRIPLSLERIVEAAIAVADEGGLDAVSMRSVARRLDVEAMSLYHHVPSKAALIDAVADAVYAAIGAPEPGADWRDALRGNARAMLRELRAHPWALAVVDSRSTPGPRLLAHHDAVLGALRAGGLPVGLAMHAYSLVDAFVFGTAITERNLPFDPATGGDEFAAGFELPDSLPHLRELVAALLSGDGFDYTDEFDFGLELILDGIARRLPG